MSNMVTHLTIEYNQKESKYLYEFVACRTPDMNEKGSYAQDNVVVMDLWMLCNSGMIIITKLMRI